MSNKATSFCDLPAEIRNRVYDLALVSAKDINLNTFRSQIAAYENALKQPPLTRVNKSIRSEALPIFYGCNKIKLSLRWCDPAVLKWLSHIGASNRKLLLNVEAYCARPRGRRRLTIWSADEVESALAKIGIAAKVEDFEVGHDLTGCSVGTAGFARVNFDVEGTDAE